MPASAAHDLILALITRRIMQSGYDIAALESSFDWLFGEGLRLPPAIIHHRPDVLGVRDRPPFLAIGDAKTTSDLGARRTSQQLLDYASLKVGCHRHPAKRCCTTPWAHARLGISHDRICAVEVPDALLSGGEP
jgi:hypothetical protein